jgi:DNA polymerase-1
MEKLLLLDTFNFLHRAYHALPKTFRDQNGEPTNAVYGVTSMIINVTSQIKPDYVVAAVDGAKPTFRVENFTGYKAHRKPEDADLTSQIPKVMEILDAFGIQRVQIDGYEADDIIAAMTTRNAGKVDVIIVSNDRDLWQLIGDHAIIMVPTTKGETEWLGHKEAIARLGFEPGLIAEYKGLRGDPSDNLPGVFGVGEVTATKLIQEYCTLEEIYKHVNEIEPEGLRKKLIECYDQAMMSRNLAKLITDVPFDLPIEACRFKEVNKLEVKRLLEKYNFKSLIRRLGFEDESVGKKKKSEPAEGQMGLF